MDNFKEISQLRFWCQKVLPLVYDDSLSYLETLGKITKKLNDLIENNSLLPDFIADLIRQYISSGEIEKVMADIMANYMLNVKFPPKGLTPATGEGSKDDTQAIQGCIDYAYSHGGMAVYFPSGKYLTQPLTLRNKATLFGQDRYTTQLVMKGGATKSMLTGTVDELSLTGLGFDGNMDIQVNNVNLIELTINSGILQNLYLTDGYSLLTSTVNNDLQLTDIIFDHAVENSLVVSGDGYVAGNNLIFNTISSLVGKNFIILGTNFSVLDLIKCVGPTPNGVFVTGNNNEVHMWNNQGAKAFTDNGNNNTFHVYSESKQINLTKDYKIKAKSIQESADTVLLTALSGSINVDDLTIKADNVTKTVTNLQKTNMGSEDVIVSGTSTQKVTGKRTVDVGSSEITVNGNASQKVVGKKTVELGSAELTVDGSSKQTITGQVDINIGTLNVSTGTNNAKLKTNKLTLETVLPLGYKAPTTFNKMFKNVLFENGGIEYPVLVGDLNFDFLITPEMFGAKGDGINDDYQALADSVAYCITNKMPLSLRNGAVYGTSKSLVINDKLSIIGNFATIKALSTMETLVDFNLPDNNRVSHTVHSVIFDGNIKANTCVRYSRTSRNIFRDNVITNFVKVGFTQLLGYELQFLNNFIIGNSTINDAIGIIAGSDSYYDNVVLQDCHIALKANGGGTFFNNIHSWIWDTSTDHKRLKGSTFAVIGESQSGSANFFTNLYIDTIQYGFLFKQYASAIIDKTFVLIGNGTMGFSPTGLKEHATILYNPDNIDTRNITFGNSILIGQEPGYTDFALNFIGLVTRNAQTANVTGYSWVKEIPVSAYIGTLNYGKGKKTEYMFNVTAQITVPKTQWIVGSVLALIDLYELSTCEPPKFINVVGVYGTAFDSPVGTIPLSLNTETGAVVIKQDLPSSFVATNVAISFEFTQTVSKY